ncbi:MAG TPA: FkbM family methyltransferase, partial [Daejeonella sp.]|nr:FkbM family methyltransferase [Daejeonella sp.]
FIVKDFMTLYIYNEIFVEKSYDYPHLKAYQPVIIDIGANTGLFSLRMKQLYPESSLYSYEPFLKNFEQLEQNINLSKLRNIEIFQKGIGGRTRSEKLFLNKSNLGGHSLYEMEARNSEFVEIEIIGIADLLSNLGLDRIHLIKMDCEGAEYEIIKALDVDLVSGVEIILFESTESVYDLNELLAHLGSIGFSIEFKENSCNYIARNLKFTD